MRIARRWLATASVAASSAVSVARPVLFYNDVYKVDLPSGHRFPMGKYEAVRVQLQRELQERAEFRVSPVANVAELTTTHTADYVERVMHDQLSASELRRIGFPGGRQSIDRALSSVGGTVAAARALFEGTARPRVAGHIAGGTHHAFADRGEGYCVFNDIAVATNVIMREQASIARVLIVDLDVHQGNGNAHLFRDEPRVFTYSLHCEGNYFSKVEASDLDVEVPVGATDGKYLELLEGSLPAVFERFEPSLVFFQAGVDPLVNDRYGKLQVSRAGLRRRNDAVLALCARANTPVVLTMGGGYPRDLSEGSSDAFQTVQAHMDCYRCGVIAHERWRDAE
jgi:acetoin utilization deacetylase AcuC-like enzyme